MPKNMEQTREAQAAAEHIEQNVSFDFRNFLDTVGPAPSFDVPLGPTQDCLSVDMIHSFHVGRLTMSTRGVVEGHIAICQTCAELVTSYAAENAARMPDSLFQKVTQKIARRTTDTDVRGRRSTTPWFSWHAVPQALRWASVPALALVVVWVLYPTKPYFEHAGSRLNTAWTVFRNTGAKPGLPNDQREADAIVDKLIDDSNRGQTPQPHQVEQLLRRVDAKSSQVSPGDPRVPVWTSFRTQLSVIDALSRYETVRERTGSDLTPVKLLRVADIKDVNGVPAITLDSDQVSNENVREALATSAKESGIRRLLVYQGDKLMYDLTITDLRPTKND